MTPTLKQHLSIRGVVAPRIVNKDGTETLPPPTTNTHTYNYFKAITSNGGAGYVYNDMTNIARLAVGDGSAPITKSSIKLCNPLYQSADSVRTGFGIEDGWYYVSHEYTFPMGSIEATLTEVGLYPTATLTSGLYCGTLFDEPLEIGEENQLIITYTRYFKVIAVPALSNNYLDAHPVIGSGTMSILGETYNYTLKAGCVVEAGNTLYFTKGTWDGRVWLSSDLVSGFTEFSAGTTVNCVALTDPLGSWDSVSYRYDVYLPTTLGSFNIRRMAFANTWNQTGRPLVLMTVDTPIPKTPNHKFLLSVNYEISWSNADD